MLLTFTSYLYIMFYSSNVIIVQLLRIVTEIKDKRFILKFVLEANKSRLDKGLIAIED